MKSYILTAVFLSTVTTAYAAAPDSGEAEATDAATSQTETVAEPEEEKKVCRTERVTGSLTRRSRICLTAAQWREVNDRTRRGVDEMTSSASGGKMCVPDPADPYQGCPG